MSSCLPPLGQKGLFTNPGQSQHRLQFHWLQPVHRWGALELDDLKSWVKCLAVGKDWGNYGWHCTKILLFHSTATPGMKSIDSYAGLLNGKIIATAPSLENGPFFSFCFSLPFKKVQGENVSPVLPSWHNLLCGFRIRPVGVRSWEADNWSSSVIKWYFVLVIEPFIWKLDIPLFGLTEKKNQPPSKKKNNNNNPSLPSLMEKATQRSRKLKLWVCG